jgi:hypothetical protein
LIRRAQGTFRTLATASPAGLNVYDQNNGLDIGISAPPASAGGAIVDIPPLQAPESQDWTLQALSVNANLTFVRFGANPATGIAPPIYGRLPVLKAGIVYPAASSGTPTIPAESIVGGIALPTDATSLFTLWDPDSDPMPPTVPEPDGPVAGQFAGLPVSGSLILPQPLALISGGPQFGVGMWILPSLIGPGYINDTLGWLGLFVYNALYTIIVDDGTGPQPQT